MHSLNIPSAAFNKMALDEMIAEMKETPEEERKDTLNSLALLAGRLLKNGEITRAEFWALMKGAISAGLPEDEVRRAFSSGFKAELESSATKSTDSTNTKPKTHANEVVIQCAADVEMKPVDWLWPGWLPKGKLTILAGKGGTGKTALALLIAATITAGGQFPDGLCCELGNILIWSSEDAPEDTLAPRLKASGANLEKCFFIQGAVVGGEPRSFDPARDIPMLEEKVRVIGDVALLIVDPVVNAVSGDMNKANEVRRCLQPLVDFGAHNNCGVLGISHFKKGSAGSHAQERVLGSQAFSALARMVLVVAQDEGKERRVLARAKSNIAPDHGGFEYTLRQTTIDTEKGPIETTYAVWGSPMEGSSNAILSEVEGEKSGSALDEAVSFLRDLLADGEMTAQEIMSDASLAGFSSRTIARAKKALKVESRKFGVAGPWVWKMPGPPEHGEGQKAQ